MSQCVPERSDHYLLSQSRVHFPSSHAGEHKQEKMAVLFEEWCGANENWKSSSFLVRIRTKHSAKKKGGRRWMTQEQLATKYNCSFTAQEIVTAKESDPVLSKTQIRPHPELPNRKDLRLFLCWDESVETDEHDVVVESMFSQFEDDGDRKPKRQRRPRVALNQVRAVTKAQTVSLRQVLARHARQRRRRPKRTRRQRTRNENVMQRRKSKRRRNKRQRMQRRKHRKNEKSWIRPRTSCAAQPRRSYIIPVALVKTADYVWSWSHCF